MLETNKDDKHRDIEKVDEYWHKIGYKTGLLATGLLAGLIVGAVLAIRNTKNAIIGKQSEKALENAQTDKMSVQELDSLSRSEKLADTEYRQIAIFIDRLEQVSGSLEQGRQVGSDYIFTKSVNESRLINYTITDAKSNQQIVNFDLDKDDKISVQPIKKIAGSQARLMTFIKSTSKQINLDLEIKDLVVIEYEDIPTALTKLAKEAAEVQRSLETLKATELTNATNEEKLQRVAELSTQSDKLSALKTQAKRLQNSIDTAANANAKLLEQDPSAIGKTIKVSLLADKLADVDRTIGIIETIIGEQYQILDNIKPSIQAEPELEFAAPESGQLDGYINNESEPDYEEYESELSMS
jgi:hypothetical protein